jgi:photoactive yellow protein
MSVRTRFAGLEVVEVSDNEISSIPFGMFELDAAGVVIHYSPVSEEKRERVASGIVGRNFFDDIVSAPQVGELKSRFQAFMTQGTSVERFSLSFPHNQSSIKVQIVMAHLIEKSEKGSERFAIVRLMPERFATVTSLTDA